MAESGLSPGSLIADLAEVEYETLLERDFETFTSFRNMRGQFYLRKWEAK